MPVSYQNLFSQTNLLKSRYLSWQNDLWQRTFYYGKEHARRDDSNRLQPPVCTLSVSRNPCLWLRLSHLPASCEMTLWLLRLPLPDICWILLGVSPMGYRDQKGTDSQEFTDKLGNVINGALGSAWPCAVSVPFQALKKMVANEWPALCLPSSPTFFFFF